MSSLSDLRSELVEAINGAGYAAEGYVPEGIDPPIVIINPSDPYVERGDTLKANEFQVNYDLNLVAQTAINSAVTEELDNMIEGVVLALSDWHIVGVGQPFITIENSANFLAARVQVATIIEIN